jgi:hypothetical protein
MKSLVLVVYVPEAQKEEVKAALFASGAGRIGNYDYCCWETLGQGQFRPLEGANPFMGKPQTKETVAEWRLEMVLDAALKAEVKAALLEAHPYETPAYHFLEMIP